jgi:hypothetical protein
MSSTGGGIATLDIVKAAIIQLGKDPSADDWLKQFECQEQAWALSNALLLEPPGSVFRFWGAKILYKKARYDFIQLDPTSAQQLKVHLVSQLISVSAEASVDMPLCRYICLALSALCIELAEDGIVSQILSWLSDVVVSKPLVILELLTLLAEEVSDAKRRGKADNLSLQLTVSAGQVFDFLSTVIASTQTATVRCRVLGCFQTWVDTTDSPADFVLSKQIFLMALAGLQTPDVLESSCDVIATIIRKFCYGSLGEDGDEMKSGAGSQTSEAVLSALAPHVLAIRSTWAGIEVDPDDEENMLQFAAMTRLFVEFCDASLDMQLRGATIVGEADMMQQLLQCVAFEHSMNVSTTPLAYYYRLCDRIMNDQAIALSRDALRDKYRPCFSALLDQVHVKFRQIEIDDSIDDKVECRRDWKDAAVDCCALLGVDECLQKICGWLQRDVTSSGDIPSISASLVCLRSLVAFLPDHENVCIPWIVSILPQLWTVTALKDPIIRFIGAISPWVTNNTTCVPNLVAMLREALSTQALTVQASKSILNMCKQVSESVPIADLHAQIVSMREVLATDDLFEVDLNVLEACCVRVSKLGSADAEAALQVVLSPIASSLMGKVVTAAASGIPPSKSVVDDMIRDVARLTCVYRYSDIDMSLTMPGTQNPLFTFFVQLFPVIQQLVGIVPTFKSHESICRFYKYMIRGLKPSFLGSLGVMCKHLTDCFTQYGTSPFVYICSIW